MKTYFLLFILLGLISCGHIYVSDTQLCQQNTGYLKSAQLYFKLENELHAQEVLKIVWPYALNAYGVVTMSIYTTSSTTTAITSGAASSDTSNQAYLIRTSVKLNAQQWYILNISTANLQTQTAQYYSAPIKMSTHSGMSGTSEVGDYLMYDYNNACGFISIAPTPGSLSSVSITSTETGTSSAQSVTENKYFDATYSVYITFLTTSDYEYGGTFSFKIDDPFKWTGSCEALSKTCNEDSACQTINALSPSTDYACSVSETTVIFKRFQNATKLSINHKDYMRIKVSVKNPSYQTSAGVSVQLVSNYANYIYEILNKPSQFLTQVITLHNGAVKYLWGLSSNTAATKGCPVRVYISTTIAQWNKITIPFYPELTLPESKSGFSLRVDVKGASVINDLSIYTDAAAYSGQVTCVTDTSDATEKYLICKNIAKLTGNQEKNLKFAFVLFSADYALGVKFATFGTMILKRTEDDKIITSSSKPTIEYSQIYNANFAPVSGNGVLDMDAPLAAASGFTEFATFADVLGATTTGRSSIKYTNEKTNLFFPITSLFMQQCCAAHVAATNYLDCKVDVTNAQCSGTIANKADSLILKIIANNNALTLSQDDKDSSDTTLTVYQGVELVPSRVATAGTPPVENPGMFGMASLSASPVVTDLCMSATTGGQLICSTYTRYVTYLEAQTDASTKKYLYNHWFTNADSLELHLVCYTGHADTTKLVCGGAENTKMGVLMRNVKLNIMANNLYPQQTDLDFIMCFRYLVYTAAATNVAKDGSTTLASTSLINAQIINFILDANNAVTSNSTMFRVGILNYYYDWVTGLADDHIVSYVPTLLRIGGVMQTDEVSQNEGIAFFFDGLNVKIDESKLSSTMPLLPTECGSSTSTGMTCKYYKSRTIITNLTDMHQDYYPGLHSIMIGGVAVTAGAEFNYYIPVAIKSPAFKYAFIGLMSNFTSYPTMTSVYKLYGTVERTTGVDWQDQAVTSATSITQSAVAAWAAYDATSVTVDTLTSKADWEISGSTIGIFNTKTTGLTKASYQGYSKAGIIYPGDVITDATIDGSVDAGCAYTGTVNDDTSTTTGMKKVGQTYAASMHLVVHSLINYWEGATVTWSLENTLSPFKAKCAKMAISSYYDATHNSTAFLIICPFEGQFLADTKMTGVTPVLKLSTWSWPDYYGQDMEIGGHLRYLWTDKLGDLIGYLAESKKSAKRLGCVLGTAGSIYSASTNQKKALLSITPLNSIALLPTTGTLKGKESITIKFTVSGGGTYATVTTDQCQSGLPSIKCAVSKSGNIFSFVLTNVDTKNIQTIPNSQLTLTFWLSSSSASSDTLTFTGEIVGTFYVKYPTSEGPVSSIINDCASAQPWTSGGLEDRSLTIGDPNREILVIGARTSFSFSFSSSYQILDLSKFTINLAFLATANDNLATNLRCAIYSGNTISHLFDKFAYSSLSAVELQYKQQDTTLLKPTEIGAVSYKFECSGGEVLANAPSASSLINVKNILTNTIGEGSCPDQSANYGSLRSVSSSSVATISVIKTFDIAGHDSTYRFNVKVTAKTEISATNVTTTSIRFKAGSYFYVEFARDISPRFNKLGIIRCYHEGYPTYCKYESERRIAFIARTDLNHNLTYGHNFSIVGVQRPTAFTNYKKMYFALVPYLSTFNQLEFQDSAIEDEPTIDQAVISLPVVYYSQDSSNSIRSTFSLTMHIKFPTGTVLETVPIWVDFPADFDEAMFLGWSPSCQFKNVKVNDNDTISNFANSCALDSNRRVKFNMTTDSNHTGEKLYSLSISGIPTYNYEQYHTNTPIVWHGNATSTTVPIYKTNLGYFNGTYNLKAFTFSDSATKQLFKWDSNIPECYIGTYRCNAQLKISNSENFFKDILSFTSTGTYSDSFSFNPSKLAVETGKPFTKFEIAPKSSTAPGLYQLKWNHEVTASYSVIPPLFIIALNSQTQIAAKSSSYEVPNGGKSLPIIFDFEGKMPENDVSITGVAKSLELNGTSYIISKYVSFKEAQKTLTYSESYLSSQIQFIVTGQTVTGTNEPEIPAATLSWTLSGTNAKAYATPSSITVTVVKAQEGTPELALSTPETTNCVGYQTITAKCSQSGTLYYVVSQDQTATQIEFSTIKTASEDANILETEIGTVYTNPKRTFYGYALATNAQTDYSITMTGKLQSEATHYLRMYCVNQMETGSVASDTTWKQSSNNGKPLISAMKFESTNHTNGTQYVTLTAPQKKEVACIICKEAKVQKDRVFGTDGVACAELGSVSTANTTANTTKRLLQTTTNATEYYVVMPDLFVTDGSLDTVKTTLESSAFSTALTSSTTLAGIALNSITCSINSGYPSTPLINSPSVSPAENSITFTWTGANNTDGFVFVGVVQYTNATVEPTALQLKKNSGYTFDAFNKAFYYKDTSISVTASPATKCLDYKYYWVATNEDPDTYQYTTGMKSGTTKTIGCPTFGSMLSQSVLFIALIFLMIFA